MKHLRLWYAWYCAGRQNYGVLQSVQFAFDVWAVRRMITTSIRKHRSR